MKSAKKRSCLWRHKWTYHVDIYNDEAIKPTIIRTCRKCRFKQGWLDGLQEWGKLHL